MWTRERRLAFLAGVLLATLTGFFIFHRDLFSSAVIPGLAETVLDGENEITSLQLLEVDPFVAKLALDYFYNGVNGRRVEGLIDTDLVDGEKHALHGFASIAAGRNTATVAIPRGRALDS